MRKILATLAAATLASPALAASGPFVSLGNTNFVVLISFLIFIGALVYLKVPSMLGKKLDERAENIQAELDEARSLREEAQTLLASYERKQKEVQEQADRIVAHAKEEAAIAANQAKQDLKDSIARRLKSAEDQIGSAESRAIRDVRDQAISIAIAAAKDVIAKQMTAAEGNALIEASISEVNAKLN